MATLVVTSSSDVSRAEMTISMVLRSYVQENRNSTEKPEIDSRPEISENQAEVEIAAPISLKEFGLPLDRTRCMGRGHGFESGGTSVRAERTKKKFNPHFLSSG